MTRKKQTVYVEYIIRDENRSIIGRGKGLPAEIAIERIDTVNEKKIGNGKRKR